MTNMILVVSAAGVGFLAQKGLRLSTLPVSGALMLLGIFGAVASAKYYERFRLHLREAGAIRQKIDETFPDLMLTDLVNSASRDQLHSFPLLARIPLYSIWISLHLLIVLVGALISAVILGRA
jgi:hypothetical protein